MGMCEEFGNSFGTVGSLPVLFWKMVMKYLKEPQDILAMSQVSPILKTLLEESGALFAECLRIMLNQPNKLNIQPVTLYNCRLTCRRGREVADEALLQDTLTRFPKQCPPEYLFDNVDKIQRFMDTFNGTGNGMSSFFMSVSYLRAANAEIYAKALELLSHHGSHLRQVHLRTFDFERRPNVVWNMLQNQLNYLRSIQSLSISGILEHQELPLAPLVLPPLPALPSLRKLKLTGLRFVGFGVNDLVGTVMSSLIPLYGNLLTDFSANETLFRRGVVEADQNWNLLPNLQRFQLETEDSRETMWSYILRRLEDVRWPMLIDLSLGYNSNYGGDDAFIPFSSGLMRALENFRNSLQKLELGGQLVEPEADEEDIAVVGDGEELTQILPHLRTLCVGNSSRFPPNFWEMCSRRFPNVTELDLLAFYGEYVLEWEDYFFMLFPLLNGIRMKERDGGQVFRLSGGCRQLFG
ncbi:unnamed protein product [Orchesella dallaii]|uniref:F-box domain-containing protein n=1 Tax=Orchesella dallaii TaxID=48710 RepID=A0ABP1RME7_9HEXA